MPVFGSNTPKSEIDDFNRYLREEREKRYTPAEIAEIERIVRSGRPPAWGPPPEPPK